MTGIAYVSPEVFDARKALTEGLAVLRAVINDLLHQPLLSVVDRQLGIDDTARITPFVEVTGPDTARPTGVPPRDPNRPAPDDPHAEMWQLVERAQNGEAEAFGQIYDRYLDTVFRYIYFRVGSRTMAEDLTSDVFLRALKGIGNFKWQGRDIGAWLVTIARNIMADYYKSGRYRLEVTGGDVVSIIAGDSIERGPEGNPAKAAIDHITNVTLLSAVKMLTSDQQECIVLRFIQGFSVAETARAMGKNVGALKALQYRALRNLAKILPDDLQPGAAP